MEFLLKKVDQAEKWNDFVQKNALDNGLLQSWEWGEFQQSLGKKIWFWQVEKNNKILAASLVVEDALALQQKTLDVLRGPVFKQGLALEEKKELWLFWQQALFKKARERGAMVARVDFAFPYQQKQELPLKQSNWRRYFRDIEPRSTLVLALQPSVEELFASFKPKHRYNIRLAQRKGVTIQRVDARQEKWQQEWWRLTQLTSQRNKFAVHPFSYYQKFFFSSVPYDLFFAFYQEKPIAAILVAYFRQQAIYLHGASDYAYRRLMAPYLLQWQAIQRAREKGILAYDFGGVKSAVEESSSQKNWEGITRFKKGFCPRQPNQEFLGVWVKPCRPFIFSLYSFLWKTRKILKK